MSPSEWDDPAIAILTRMRAEGATAGMIANKLNAEGYTFTRNAVIGKTNRLKLPPPSMQAKLEMQAALNINPALKKNRQVLNGKIHTKQKFFFHRKPQPLGAQAALEVVMDARPSNPTASNAILLSESQDGQCRAIIDYENGEISKAIICGEPTPLKLRRGKLIRGSWCQHHNELYTIEDRPHR